jgi:RimJ/RimL family protein N-acetyltransferase
MTDGPRIPELHVPALGRQPALILRPWRAADIPALTAEMSREYPTGGMWSRRDERPARTARQDGADRRTGPAGEPDAARWLASQALGWRDGDRLSFAVLEEDDAGGGVLAGNVGLKNREETGRIGERETAEIGYWTAVAARGRGIAPAAVRAVTAWVFDAFAGTSLRQIMLVHNVDNPASCRVAEKAGYPFRELSPANPPHWFTDGHIHMQLTGHGDEGADGGWSKALKGALPRAVGGMGRPGLAARRRRESRDGSEDGFDQPVAGVVVEDSGGVLAQMRQPGLGTYAPPGRECGDGS